MKKKPVCVYDKHKTFSRSPPPLRASELSGPSNSTPLDSPVTSAGSHGSLDLALLDVRSTKYTLYLALRKCFTLYNLNEELSCFSFDLMNVSKHLHYFRLSVNAHQLGYLNFLVANALFTSEYKIKTARNWKLVGYSFGSLLDPHICYFSTGWFVLNTEMCIRTIQTIEEMPFIVPGQLDWTGFAFILIMSS